MKSMGDTRGEELGKMRTGAIGRYLGWVTQRASRGCIALSLVSACIAAVPTATHAATITVVHGINGADLGLASSLPVDIAVNGKCALKGVSFTQSTKVDLAAGAYAITVHPANGSCSTAPVITQTVNVPATTNSIGLVANLSDSGVPQLAAFINETLDKASITVNNAASNAPIFAGAGPGGWIFYHANQLRNGSGVMLLGGSFRGRVTVKLFRANSRRTFFSEKVRLTQTLVYYVVGSNKSGLRVVVDTVA